MTRTQEGSSFQSLGTVSKAFLDMFSVSAHNLVHPNREKYILPGRHKNAGTATRAIFNDDYAKNQES